MFTPASVNIIILSNFVRYLPLYHDHDTISRTIRPESARGTRGAG
ncbi:hypothetical protein [Rubritalea tangerina]